VPWDVRKLIDEARRKVDCGEAKGMPYFFGNGRRRDWPPVALSETYR
jgi:hypothetical protein